MAATKVTPQVTWASVSVVPPTEERVCERVCVCGRAEAQDHSGNRLPEGRGKSQTTGRQ